MGFWEEASGFDYVDLLLHCSRDRLTARTVGFNVGAFIIRTGCRGILYYDYNKEPQNSIANYSGPFLLGLPASSQKPKTCSGHVLNFPESEEACSEDRFAAISKSLFSSLYGYKKPVHLDALTQTRVLHDPTLQKATEAWSTTDPNTMQMPRKP